MWIQTTIGSTNGSITKKSDLYFVYVEFLNECTFYLQTVYFDYASLYIYTVQIKISCLQSTLKIWQLLQTVCQGAKNANYDYQQLENKLI